MKPELEGLLRAYDAFKVTPEGPEAAGLRTIYEAKPDDASHRTRVSKEALHKAVLRFHSRWVRANLPPGFPKKLGEL